MKTFYTLSFITLLSLQARSQSGPLPPDRDAAAKIIKFYPNPATSIINFEFQKDYDKSYSFQVFSFLGKKVYDISNITPKTVVNLGDFYRGIYIFQLRDRNGRVVDSGKFQVSK
ncbi:MAG: T9SS type A sorting domain-containing protein [Chitinophagaceae bacterium]|nr:T9SS type A sorting domain-containing protein [Chitinophagaceae bacterium]